MKIECSCGAKHEFELRPEMQTHPVQFICPACGLDASDFVDGLVRRELGQNEKPTGTPIPALASATPSAAQPSPRTGVRLRPTQPLAEAKPAPAQTEALGCPKHPGEVATDKCYICSKPICPKCMALFGYVCSPLCKAKAESRGITLPVYEGQASVLEARRWRKMVRAGTAAGVLLVVLLGLWFWYDWFGCLPKPVFSVRFAQPAYSGQSVICGNHQDQIVFLHGATLARYDLKSGQEAWSRQVLDQEEIQRAVNRELQAAKALVDKATSEAWERIPKMPSAQEVTARLERAAAAALSLHVRGQNVWVASPGKLVRCAWATGKIENEIPVPSGSEPVIHRGDELVFVDTSTATPAVTHVDMSSGRTQTERLGQEDAQLLAANASKPARSESPAPPEAGLPTGTPAGQPMSPAKAAEQAQHMSLARKIALPAVLAANLNQQRALNELDDHGRSPAASGPGLEPGSSFSLIPGKEGFVELAVKLLEAHLVSRSAVKAGKPGLEGEVTAGQSMELSNEMLNDLQRSNGGDIVQEDHSRYQVSVRRPGSDTTWTGEVVGPPKLYPLDTVNVLAADKLLIVLDKANRKLWQGVLGFNISAAVNALDEESAPYGRGPCVERNGALYVFDEGVLSAFDLKTGTARWRLPTVGVAGIFFDAHDMLYVNTTTASYESLKYSRQIDLSRKVLSVILKVDSRNGKILWSTQSQGLVNYVWHGLVLTAQSYQPDETTDASQTDTGFQQGPWLRIRRLSPSNGRELWEHYQERAPVDIGFDRNAIRLVFKKEVQVLRFPTL